MELAVKPAASSPPHVAPVESAALRDARSDVLKAAAIVGVVLIHAGLPFANALRFGVPVFVAIWAFHYEQGLARRKGRGWSYAGHRFVRLLIPYLFWTTIYVVMFRSLADWKSTPLHTIVGGWFGGYGWAGQYFFIILFQLTWLAPLLRRWVTPSSLPVVVVAGILLNAVATYFLFENRVVSGIGDRLFVYWIMYVFLGVAFAQGFPRPRIGFLVVALVLLAAPGELHHLTAANSRATLYLPPTVTVGSVALLLALGPRSIVEAASFQQPRSGFRRVVDYIGRHSFDIYVGHVLVLEGAGRIVVATSDSLRGITEKAALAVFAIGVSLVIGWTLRRLGLGILVGA